MMVITVLLPLPWVLLVMILLVLLAIIPLVKLLFATIMLHLCEPFFIVVPKSPLIMVVIGLV